METKHSIGYVRAYLLILPAMAAFLLFMLWPLVQTVYLSLFQWNMIRPVKIFVGFQNYIQLFQDPVTYRILRNTGEYILLLLAFNFAVPYVLAFILSVLIHRGQFFYKAAVFLPSVISLVVGSMLYLWILNPVSGPVAFIAQGLGITLPVWSKSSELALVVISLITSWKVFGYNFIVLVAGISGIPQEVMEAARMDKVPDWKIFMDIVLPMSSASGVYVLVMTVVQGLQYVFVPIKVLTQGGPNYASSNLIYQSYHQAFTLYKTGTSAAFSVITMILFAALLYLLFHLAEKGAYYEDQ